MSLVFSVLCPALFPSLHAAKHSSEKNFQHFATVPTMHRRAELPPRTPLFFEEKQYCDFETFRSFLLFLPFLLFPQKAIENAAKMELWPRFEMSSPFLFFILPNLLLQFIHSNFPW